MKVTPIQITTLTLSNNFYQGERSLRASGFDITHRFGPFGGNTTQYAPVCLNSLLYKTEIDLAYMAGRLKKSHEKNHWLRAADKRKRAITHYLYNPQKGIFVDYNFITRKQSNYNYATTFYPLWAGAASIAQAKSVEQHLALFEAKFGLLTSDRITGLQWDKPFGWAPLQLLAVEGLLKYDYKKDALRLAEKFNDVIELNFQQTKGIYEKYNMLDGSIHTSFIGYHGNALGFGWSNATYLIFQKLLAQ